MVRTKDDKGVWKYNNTIIELNSTEFMEDPLPLEIFNLSKPAVDKQLLVIYIEDHFGSKGGLDYFDIVRTNDNPQILNSSLADCTKKTQDCKPKPQFCSAPECISDSIMWQDVRYPNLVQFGCSTLSAKTLFEKKAKCVKKTAITEETEFPLIIDTSISTNMAPCTVWNEDEPCPKEVLSSIESTEINNVITSQFKITTDDCKNGSKIEVFDSKLKKGNGKFLSYLEMENSSVEVGMDENCFHLQHGLCGPDSLSFQSVGGHNLFMTLCDGKIIMKKEYDFCGSV